jgi:hypothetical protein
MTAVFGNSNQPRIERIKRIEIRLICGLDKKLRC